MTGTYDPILAKEIPFWPLSPEEEPVPVLLPPPPSAYGQDALFVNEEASQRSQQALQNYRAEYASRPLFPQPLEVLLARHTGLPAFLNGYLADNQVPDIQERPQDVAEAWLLKDILADAVFGVDPRLARERLRYAGHVNIGQGELPSTLSIHVRFQQWHELWPVFGCDAVVHLVAGDPRTSVTSSYFPIGTDMFAEVIDEAQAVRLAQQVLAAYLDPPAIGLCALILATWLENVNPEDPAGLPWTAIEARIAEKLIYALAAFSRTHEHVFPDIETVVDAGQLPGTQEELLALLRPAWQTWYSLNPGQWTIEPAPYAGKLLFILPFAGSYYLARQIELTSPNYDQAWRVFVDAQTAQVLGRPESRIAQAGLKYFRISGNPQEETLSVDEAHQIDLFLSRFTALEFADGRGQISLVAIEGGGNPEPEAVNIAYHAYKMLDYFLNVCHARQEDLLGPRLRVEVGYSSPAGNALDMGFLPSSREGESHLITFQTDSGRGLVTAARIVHEPSLSREVISHEMTHGVQYLLYEALNASPVQQPVGQVPFAAPLQEGYANYFARSLAAHDDGGPLHFARRAYRPGTGPLDWDDMWLFDRPTRVPGEDLLPKPNLYPVSQTQGLPVYKVGMVWARALWDIRGLLPTPDLADELALKAYLHASGWLSNFEVTAIRLINEARNAGCSEETINGITRAFCARGILDTCGIRALARSGPAELCVASAEGISFSADDGATWSNWMDLGGGRRAKGIVALALGTSVFFAAAEDAVYARDAGGTWAQIPNWPAGQIPTSLQVVGDVPYVGTGSGVWEYTGNAWRNWGSDRGTALGKPALSLADVIFPGMRVRYAVTGEGISFRQDNEPRLQWQNPHQIPGAVTTAMAVTDTTVYVGTLAAGIWRQEVSLDDGGRPITPCWEPYVNYVSLGQSAVLCLAVDQQRVWAGTTSGLYQITGNPTQATQVGEGDVLTAMVTSVLPVANNVLLAGTAAHGLWRSTDNGFTWTLLFGIGL